ncbi:MAG: hypothetical protein OXQ29_28125 [Rhodospirillaceae bacterium]|nr:hypothetical protein [Rhodospirillaceae bacterium]
MRVLSILAVGWLIGGCGGDAMIVPHTVALVEQTETVPEDELFDVGVVVFDPGVPDGEIERDVLEELLEDGTFVHIRRTEAHYMAVHLRNTLQNSGHWGSVWTLPRESTAADINVSAEILHSDGSRVRLRVRAVDSTGREWIDDEYSMQTAPDSFNRQQYPGLDPYQDVFNRIANDLAEVKHGLPSADIHDIRTVAQLRFAGELSPEAFGEHVVQERDGRFVLNRLPAEDDPQLERTRMVRDREHLFVETLNEHYADVYVNSKDAYHGWRDTARQETVAIRELENSARWRTFWGVVGVIASVALELASDGDFSDRVASDSLMYASAQMLESGQLRREEMRIHIEALEEFSESLDAQLKPMIVEIDGIEHRLTGTAESQYEDWRELLRRIFVEETGFGNVGVNSEASDRSAHSLSD